MAFPSQGVQPTPAILPTLTQLAAGTIVLSAGVASVAMIRSSPFCQTPPCTLKEFATGMACVAGAVGIIALINFSMYYVDRAFLALPSEIQTSVVIGGAMLVIAGLIMRPHAM